MAEILSQAEIDALLAQLTNEDNSNSNKKQENKIDLISLNNEGPPIKNYDFKRPKKFSKEQLSALSAIMETFCRNVSTYLTSYLRLNVVFSVIGIDEIIYEEFTNSIPKPAILNIFKMSGFEGDAILSFNPDIGCIFTEKLCGSGVEIGKTTKIINRPSTEIEINILKKLMRGILDSLASSFSNIIETEAIIEGIESNPQFVQVAANNENVVVVNFEIKIGNGYEGFGGLCLPYIFLEPIINQLSNQKWYEKRKKRTDEIVKIEKEKIYNNLYDTEAVISVILGFTNITFFESINLQPGDVILLDNNINEEVIIEAGHKDKVEGIKLFKGKLGEYKNKYAVKVTQKYQEGKEMKI